MIRGETVTLNCNATIQNISLINWKKDKFVFAYRTSDPVNVSTLTSDKLQIYIDSNSVWTVKLLNAQPDDAGRYVCDVTGDGGVRTIVWSLQVSEEPPGRQRWRQSRSSIQRSRWRFSPFTCGFVQKSFQRGLLCISSHVFLFSCCVSSLWLSASVGEYMWSPSAFLSVSPAGVWR